ncbi:MAG: anthranilate phosphoribosyltransferase [Gemmataceae bacterium]
MAFDSPRLLDCRTSSSFVSYVWFAWSAFITPLTIPMTNSHTVSDYLSPLVQRRDLGPAQMRTMMEYMMSGHCGDVETGALLAALRTKGETIEEVATAAAVLREHMVRWDPGSEEVLDTCGTGGDGLKTFNISTATALVVAGAGVPVVKHGNRAVTSRSGSADVLSELGIHIEGDATTARVSLERAGLAFCYAPLFHPAMKHVAPVRKRLGIPTIFNCLGPLANPAGAKFQLLGVGRPELLDLLAGALAILAESRAVVVWGEDGLAEVTLSARTHVRRGTGYEGTALVWSHEDFGLPLCHLKDLEAESSAESAALIRRVLVGEDIPATNVVLANAAAALFIAGKAKSPREGVEQARQAIRAGAAAQVLAKLIELSE